ncbi:hypothetical protein [Sorangium sp. So ce233]|uniref:hypothetical protein n=1 Tax=Sorangium sp. So ce233 TaxID=3133290 RepID=UPI003F6113F5
MKGGYAQTRVERDLVQFDGQLLFQETVIDANGKSRNTYWDVGGRIAAVEEWNRIDEVEQQIVTRYVHNPLGELVRVTDARSNATEARYDTVGRMVELVSPDAGRTEWRYDLAGNLRAKQTAELALRGQLIRYEYDFNRLRKIDYPVTQDVVYTYGDAEEAGDAQGNRAGRLEQETSAAGTRSYRYDRFGNVAELVAEFPRLREPHRGPYQASLKYVFDSLGRMQERSGGAGGCGGAGGRGGGAGGSSIALVSLDATLLFQDVTISPPAAPETAALAVLARTAAPQAQADLAAACRIAPRDYTPAAPEARAAPAGVAALEEAVSAGTRSVSRTWARRLQKA